MTLNDRALTFDRLPPNGAHRMYAIAFDLETESLRLHYSATSPNNAYAEIRAVLDEVGFRWQQGSVYFGAADVIDAVSCVEVTRRLARELPWFAHCVRDIRMLRIEENNDLNRVIRPSF